MGNKSRGNFRMGECLKGCKCPLHKPKRAYKPERTKPETATKKIIPPWMIR